MRRLPLLLALAPSFAMADVVTPPVVPAQAQPVITVDPTGAYVAGGGDASSANQASQITIETATRDRIGDAVASPAANTLGDRLKTIATNTLSTATSAAAIATTDALIQTNTATVSAVEGTIYDTPYSGSGAGTNNAILKAILAQTSSNAVTPVSIDHTTPGTTDAVVVNGVATAAGQGVLNASVGTPGSAAAGSAIQVQGTDGTNGRALKTSSNGGLVPAQAAPISINTPLTASTIMQIDSGLTTDQRNGRLLVTVQLDGVPGGIVYLCFAGQSTTCSASNYDIKVASNAADATLYTAPFGTTNALYAFTTASGVKLNVSNWIAQ